MLQFVDTHTHLYDEAFISEEDNAVERAIKAGVTKMIVPDIDSSTRDNMFRFTDRHPDSTRPCLGLHPTSVDSSWQIELSGLESYKHRYPNIIAIGEIGIDCYWSKEFIKEQEEAFRAQLDLASELDLPVIIHSRESTQIILNILNDYKGKSLRGVMHAFSGSYETYTELQKTGDWYIGIGGVLTYKKAGIAEVVKHIPLQHILLETDSPYLPPVPFRGRRNESSYIPYIAEKLASITGKELAEIAEITTLNAQKLFKI